MNICSFPCVYNVDRAWSRETEAPRGSLKMFQAADLSLGRISASRVWRLFQRPTCVRINCYFFMDCPRAVHSVYTWPHSTRPRTLLAILVTRELEMEVGRLAAVRLSASKRWSREVTDSGSRTPSNPLVWFDVKVWSAVWKSQWPGGICLK